MATELKIITLLDPVPQDAPGPCLRLMIGDQSFDLSADCVGKLIGVLGDKRRELRQAEMTNAANRALVVPDVVMTR
ncbi:hypothetical protein LCGC14_1092510 [marine sediment metagenome]|uniref:Uncharacterized protein n=1 Tax=marine sediment metagenome TaxID=412755 RepID=A0A0F9MC07_9ZZZZ